MFTTTQTFEPAMPYAHQRTLLLKANGGKVIVEAMLDKGSNVWIKTDEKNADGGYILSCGNAVIRITPSGGAQYDLV